MLDKREFQNKPEGREVGAIQNRLETSQVELTLEELATYLIQGCTFKPALLNGKSCDTWLQQQAFALDFDNDVIFFNSKGNKTNLKSLKGFKPEDLFLEPEIIAGKYNLTFKDCRTCIDEQLLRCKEIGIYPVFGYTSFSHTEAKHKFRLVFCTDEIITDPIIRCKLQYTLIKVFDKSDNVTFDAARLFFGGRSLICEDYHLISANEIIEKHYTSEYDNEVYQMVSNITLESLDTYGVSRKCYQDNKEVGYRAKPSLLSYIPKTPLINYEIIKAIKNRNTEYIKNKLQFQKTTVINNQEYMDYIRKIDIAKLFEIKYPNNFKCIFHSDSKPSATIFTDRSGYYFYKCHSASCGKVYNILGIIEKLAGFKSRPKAHKFIREIFNIEFVESEFQKEQKEILTENIMFLTSGEFRQQCPTAYSNISRNLEYLVKLHKIAMDNIKNENLTDEEGSVAFFASASYLCKEFKVSLYSLNNILKKNVQMAYHGLINKLDENEIPEKMLKRSRAISVNNGNQNNKNINVYSIPSFVQDQIEEIEKQGIKWKENKYTMRGLSREMFYRAEGKNAANRLYPQYKNITVDGEIKDRTTSFLSDERTLNIVKAIFEIIESKKYVTEKDIVYFLSDKYKYITTEAQIKKSLKEILDSYGLERVRANKELKIQYEIQSNGYPFIIIKNKETDIA